MSLYSEWNSKERWVSPILFATLMIVMFFFAFGEDLLKDQLIIAVTYVVCFFAIQLALLRSFESDQEDGAFELLRTYPISGEVWFLSKLVCVVLISSILTLATVIAASFFLQSTALFDGTRILILGLVLFGLASNGVLLAALVEKADGKAILFPLLFFPLTTPLLIAGIQAEAAPNLWSSWGGLIVIFDVLYFGVSIICFDTLVKAD